jgi:hypothetical protein
MIIIPSDRLQRLAKLVPTFARRGCWVRLLRVDGVACTVQRIHTAVNLGFLTGAATISSKKLLIYLRKTEWIWERRESKPVPLDL